MSLPGGNGASIAGDWDPDGTDIPDADLGIVEPVGSCENCGINILMANRIYRVGLSWYVRLANVSQWIDGRAIRNDRHFSTRAEARAYVQGRIG